MFIEILFTLLIFLVAGFILYKNISKKSSGKCDCGSCSTHCPNYAIEHEKKTLKK